MRKNVAAKPFMRKEFVPYRTITAYMKDIFSTATDADGCIVLRSGTKGHAEQSFFNVNKTDTDAFYAELARHDYRDCFFTFATFSTKHHAQRTENKLANIYAWSIDVDYKNESIAPLDMYDYIMENVELPTPNYVEYGHRLRMIYLFKEPLRLFPTQRTKLLQGYRFLQKVFVDRINNELSFGNESFGAESNPPTSFFRIPGSVNTKDGSTIKIKKITNERMSMQEVFDEYVLTNETDKSACRDTWYDTWKVNYEKKHKIAGGFNSYRLWERRLALFESLQKDPQVGRKRLLFFVGCAYLQLGMAKDASDCVKLLLKFNHGLCNPLSEKDVISRFRQIKAYSFKDITICQTLDLPVDTFCCLSKKQKDAKRYETKREAQIALGLAKFQKMQKRRNRVAYLITLKTKSSEICKELGVSISTLKRDLKYLAVNDAVARISIANRRRPISPAALVPPTAPSSTSFAVVIPHTSMLLDAMTDTDDLHGLLQRLPAVIPYSIKKRLLRIIRSAKELPKSNYRKEMKFLSSHLKGSLPNYILAGVPIGFAGPP